LWSQVVSLETDHHFQMSVLPDYSEFIQSSVPAYKELLIPDLKVTDKMISLSAFKFDYQPRFWIFDDSVDASLSQVAPMHHPGRFVLEELIQDTIELYSLNHTEACKLLLSLPSFLSQDFTQTYNIHQSIVEVLFMQMLSLPRPREKLVYYSTLLMDLCKGALDKIPSAMGRSLTLMFKRLDTPNEGMDVECIQRLCVWFSHHLSNFGFSWKWKEWVPAIQGEVTSGPFIFVRELLQKCLRLSYYDRIKSVLPESFHQNENVFPIREPSFVFVLEGRFFFYKKFFFL
jgi:nuclear cap-binding protein subunit 1